MIFNSELLTHDSQGDWVNYLHIMIMMTSNSNSKLLTHDSECDRVGLSVALHVACVAAVVASLLARYLGIWNL